MATPRINVLVNDEAVDPRLLGLLTRLEVRESDEDAALAAMRFRLVQEPSGTYSPIDDEVFVAGAAVAVELAAPGGNPQRLFSGFVTHVRPHFEGIEANCYVEVLAMDPVVMLDAEDRAAQYPDASDSDAVEEILGRYQISVSTEPTAALHKKDYQLLMQRSTDWSFIRHLARRNGYACYFEPDEQSGEQTFHFKPRDLTGTAQADLTIQREGTNLRWIDLQLKMTGPIRHLGAAIDPIRKRIVRTQGEAEAETLGGQGLDGAIEGGLRDAGANASQAWLRDPYPLDAAIQAQGTAATDADTFVIEARGELDCELYRGLLRARRPVLVKGIGRLFTGTYYVTTVRTTVDQGLLTQTFIAQRNALDQSGQEEFGQQAEEAPAQ